MRLHEYGSEPVTRGAVLFPATAASAGAGAPRGDALPAEPPRSRPSRTLASPAVLAVAAAVAAGCATHVVRPPLAPAVDARCGTEPGICLLGVPAPSDEPGVGFGWRCLGVNGGAPAECSLSPGPSARRELVPESGARPEVAARPVLPPRFPAASPAAAPRSRGRAAAAGRFAGGQSADEQIAALLAAKAQRTPAQRKVGSLLLDFVEAGVPLTAAVPDADVLDAPVALRGHYNAVPVDIRADVTPDVVTRIRALGGTVVNSVPRYRSIRARLPLSAVEPLATLDAVRSIRRADEVTTHGQQEKTNTSEGDVAHRADWARATHDVDGSGIGIGVVSDGVESLAARQASGDLPALVKVLAEQAGEGDEGTALLEIVHDLAPGAELYFATGHGGQAQLAANIEALCDAGAHVIVDDVYYPLEAAFQDDIVTQGINAATADGCFHFSAAGNAGNLNDGTSGVWEGDYAAGSPLTVNGEAAGVRHDFGGGVVENRVTRRGDGFILQWADPLGASASDYDLFVVDAEGEVLASSTNTQDGTQDPIESIPSDALPAESIDGPPVRVVVLKVSGADRYLRLDTLEGRLAIATAGQSSRHSGSAHAISVAAVDVRTAGGAGGVFDGTESVESFSSDGPRRLFFQPDGTPITPDDFSATGGLVLQKPDLAAADGVSTATPPFNPFYGTSAAAPHAAAIAALMLQAWGDPATVTLAELRTAMTESALDIELPGVDRDSGAGIVMAARAVAAVPTTGGNGNGAPEAVGTLADRTLALADPAVTLDVAGAFRDPDDDVLTYTAWSTAPDRLAVSLTGSQLKLTPAAPGRAVVAVRATDPDGLRVLQTFSVAVTVGNRDYDGDDDGLIDIANLAQLEAVRYDRNGDGSVDRAADWSSYYAAFAEGASDMGCPLGCVGYELTADLDFDTNGNGRADAGDSYWNNGYGWWPVGGWNRPFRATFEGNGRTVSNLFIRRPQKAGAGLFGVVARGVVHGVGLIDVDVEGLTDVGGLVGALGAGSHEGEIDASYVTGRVSGKDRVGGLTGGSGTAWVVREYSAAITASYSSALVSGAAVVGGLVGLNNSIHIVASYATGHVSGSELVGGLAGYNAGRIVASYATGRVSGDIDVGGLVGTNYHGWGSVTASYWETAHTALQAPTDYVGIYRTWNMDLDGDGAPDDPWDFGTAAQYPVLRVDVNGDGQGTWQEFGHQLRAGPTLTATAGVGQGVALTWTAADTSPWSPPPGVTYTLTRDDGDRLGTVATDLQELQYADTAARSGVTYAYRVDAVVHGGASRRSRPLRVVAGVANQPPFAVGSLPHRTLRVDGGSQVVDVAGAFSDLDDVLTYAATSSDVAVVAVGVSGSEVTITPVAPGRATIAVTATDVGGRNTTVTQRFEVGVWTGDGVDYDADDDGLIEIMTLAQLDAVRHDPSGDGVPAVLGAPAYAVAFPDAGAGMGCPSVGGCAGYELWADLDFDTDGNRRVDAFDAYWHNGLGWFPLGNPYDPFAATFEGNGRTVSHLFIGRGTDDVGLFGGLGGVVRGVGLIDVDVSGRRLVGGLAGTQVRGGEIGSSYVTGRVSGEYNVGGLVGVGYGTVTAAYSAARVSGQEHAGGLVGMNFNTGRITAGYATGRVSGSDGVGGLAGRSDGQIRASYATGRVAGDASVGELVGVRVGSITASYSDAHGALQTPTGYDGIYQSWNLDLDGDGAADDPWDFGTAAQYPVLVADFDGDGSATWQEFGHQLRTGPTLTATAGVGQGVALTWTAADTSPWSPAPAVAYTLTRDAGVTLATALTELQYTDTGVTSRATYTYRVEAAVRGGASRSSRPLPVVADVADQPLVAVGTLPDRRLQVGATLVVDVAGAFSDLDDVLTYAASSSDVAVATVSVSGSRVTITPVAVGRATITVSATDAGGTNTTVTQRFVVMVWTGDGVDYDADDDGLIEITNLTQLDAMRHDLYGRGVPRESGTDAYAVAFPGAGAGMGCPTAGGCAGYELLADLDFDTNGNGSADQGDRYWNSGRGWDPIGNSSLRFHAIVEGNGHTVSHLFIRRPYGNLGLFGEITSTSAIRRVGLIGVDVSVSSRNGGFHVGGLVGNSRGHISSSYVTGRVSGGRHVGGLVGYNTERRIHRTSVPTGITGSYSTARVSGRSKVGGLVGLNRAWIGASYATGRVSGDENVGGLIGDSSVSNLVTGSGSVVPTAVTASYATGRVSGDENVGGLVGLNASQARIGASYSTARVSGDDNVGGLVGRDQGSVTASYRDKLTSGRSTGTAGRTTAELQAPTSCTGIYESWCGDLDGDLVDDAPWDFGTYDQYPVLVVDLDGDGHATWQEFGYQLRDGPTLTATGTMGRNEVALNWTAPEVSHWSPAPAVTYTVTRDDATTVTVVADAVSESSAIDTGVVPGGTYTYQVRAMAGGATMHSAPQTLTVVGNRPPMVVGSLANRTLPVGGGAVDVPVADTFSDLDNDALLYTALSSAPAVATARATGSTVRVTPLSGGTATITVTATDVGGSSQSASLMFLVTVPNRPPVTVGSMSDRFVRVSEGVLTVPVAGAFHDPDNDALTYGAVSSAPSVAAVVVSGSIVSVTPVSGGEAVVTVTATDAGGSNTAAVQTFTVTVANRGPEAVGTLPPLTLRVADDARSVGARSVNVSDAFRDPDGDSLTYDAWSSSTAVATVSMSGSTVEVTPVSGGTATITVTAEDAGGLSATQTFEVTVVNRSPVVVGTLSPLDLQVAERPQSVDVSGAFADPDGDALTYGASSSDTAVATVAASGSTVTVTPVSGGTATVTVTATDVGGSNTSATTTFTATVASRPPEAVGGLPALTRRVADGEASVEVSGAFRDPDGDVLTYGARSSEQSVATVSVVGSTLRVTPVAAGTATITVTATDVTGSNTSATQTFAVTVPENAGPEAVGTLEDKALLVTDSPLSVEVSGAFRDPDRDVLTYGASSSNATVATVSASGSPVVVVTPVGNGTATVTVTATDAGGSNRSATQTFRVTVARNRSPEAVGTLRALSLRVEDVAESVEVSGAFRDRDADDLTYGASSSDPSVARVSVSDSTVTVTPVSGGTATVTVRATDVGGSNTTASQTFEVTVANQPPEPVVSLPPVRLRVDDGPESVEVGFAFRDPDGDDLTYEASSSDRSMATASASGSEVEVRPVSGGTAEVTVTARDPGGLRARQTFEAVVANRPPVAVGRLPALSLRVSDRVRSVNVSDAFEDPDRDALTYEATSLDTSVATVEVSDSTVRVTPLSSGTTTVTVTAEDDGGLRAEQTFEVTVANRSPVALGTLPPLSLQVAGGPMAVDVSGAFEDPDDDVLTYGATSAAVTSAAVVVSGSTVTVTPLSSGSTTVTVTATDAGGSNTEATQRFGVSVDGGGGPGPGGGGGGGRNRGPQALGTLDARTLEVGEALSVDVTSAFRDRDRDALTYAAESAAAAVAAVTVASSVVTVTPLSLGEAVVTVTATDVEGSNRSATQEFAVTVSQDADGDGLIGVHTLAQLDAVRYDLDGDGAPAATGAAAYAAAFGVTAAGTVSVSCGASAGCAGYELGSELDFDTNGSGGPDAGDAYWHGGAGWLPLGSASSPFASRFEGNGRRIRGLFVRRGDGAGLFGATGPSSVIRHVGVVAVDVTGANAVGALVGLNGGLVTGSYATGRVSGSGAVGGLVGNNSGSIGGSHAAVQVTGETSAGGLVGINDGRVAAGYATGRVSGTGLVGGLVGLNRGALTAGYATGRVTGDGETGGLVGDTESPGTVTAGYWDTATSGQAAGAAGAADTAGEGRTTSALQAPTDYTGSYASWNVDVDGDGAADVPWDFGTDAEYPALSLDVDGDGRSTWQEVARQLRAGPAVTAAPSADPAQVALTWTAVDGGAWTPPPEVAYTVYREAGAAAETVEAGVRGTRHADRNVEPGRAYTYQVAAVVDGGEAVRSALVAAEVPCTFTVTPLHRDVLWTAGTGQVTVTTGPTCGWTAVRESEFLTVTAGAAGTGSGTVTYAVGPNTAGPRTGVLLAAGQRVTVYQASPTEFTDHPIERGVTPVRAIHFLELRARTGALRAGAGLPAFGWTDPTLVPGVTPIKRVHLTDLRTALAEAYAAVGRPAPPYTDAAVAGGTGIQAAHLMELRAAVAALGS